MPLPLLPIAAGAASVASSLISNAGNRKSQNRANKHNIKFWQMQNKYNDPAQQMARLKAAGLNPNLIYGSSSSGASGHAENIAPSRPAEFNVENPLKDIQHFANLKGQEATTNNLKEQNDLIIQETALKAQQTSEIGVKTAKNAFDLGLATELRNTSLQAAQANLRNIEQNTFGKFLDNKIKNQVVKEKVLAIKYEIANAQENLKGTKLLNKLRQLELDLKKVGIERSDNIIFRWLFRNSDALPKSPLNHNNPLFKN